MSSAKQRQTMSWGELAGFALLAGVVGLLFFSGRDQTGPLIPRGMPLPQLMASGWLNTAAPAAGDVSTGGPPAGDVSTSDISTDDISTDDVSTGEFSEGNVDTGNNTVGKIPSRERLAGRVVVIDCWATWCPPCRAAMPELAKLYAKYQPLGVEFIGLTSESEQDRPAIEKFVNSVNGFDWPVGYGAAPTFDLLGVNVLPTVIVFGPGGSSVWSSSQLYGIEDALDQALAQAAGE